MKDLSNIKGTVAVIPAAGVGSRMGAECAKQYLKINQRSILGITLSKFLAYQPIELIVLVVAAGGHSYRDLKDIDDPKIIIIEGGEERIHSVNNAMQFLYDEGLRRHLPVMVHDAVRPCVLQKDLERLSEAFAANQQPCTLVAPVVDTLKKINRKNQLLKTTIDRNNLVKTLTPQMAKFIDLHDAIKNSIADKKFFTDEASALTYAGHKVNAVYGSNSNIKITHAEDLALAEFYLQQEAK